MKWKDLVDEQRGNAWRALLLSVGAEAPRRPSFRVEASRTAGIRRLRLSAGSSPLLWARVAGDHYGYWYLRRASAPVGCQIVPPIGFGTVRAIERAGDAAGSLRPWARHLARDLAASQVTPLWRGAMMLANVETSRSRASRRGPSGALSIPGLAHLDEVLAMPAHGFTAWDMGRDLPPLALRPFSAEGSGRVKALRKLVRDDCLPPVLVMWISGLDRYVILDGHDRLLAALLEGTAPRALALSGASERAAPCNSAVQATILQEAARHRYPEDAVHPPRRPQSVDETNRLLVAAFDDRPRLQVTTRAWRLAGGVSAWVTECREELAGVKEREILRGERVRVEKRR